MGGDGNPRLRIGPVISELGGYVPDGTIVTILDRQAEPVASGALRGGVVELDVPTTTTSTTKGTFSIEVLGFVAELTETEVGR